MATIKFVRVERDCDANKSARKDAAQDGTTPRLIYDFDVMIDGEKRAAMDRDAFGKGYYVQDADGRPVDPPLPHYRTGRKVDSKAEFLTIVSELLDAGKIPTLAEMAAKRDAEAQAKREKIAAQKEKMRIAAINTHAAEAYEALKSMIAAAAYQNPATLAAKKLVATIDATAAEWAAQVDAEPGRFGVY